jgi:hypothetical protein
VSSPHFLTFSVNRAPTITPVPDISLSEESTASYTLSADDPDRNKLNLIYLSVSPSNHLQYFRTSTNSPIQLNTPITEFRGTYSPPLNYYGTTTITYKFNDGCADSPVGKLTSSNKRKQRATTHKTLFVFSSSLSEKKTISLFVMRLGTLNFIVTNVNDPPVANPISITIFEDTTAVIAFNNSYISDVDNTLTELSVKLTSLPSSGVLEVLQSPGSWVVVPSSSPLPVNVPLQMIRWTPISIKTRHPT